MCVYYKAFRSPLKQSRLPTHKRKASSAPSQSTFFGLDPRVIPALSLSNWQVEKVHFLGGKGFLKRYGASQTVPAHVP